MAETDTLRMPPIYGWGWVGTPPEATRDTPEPFDLVHVQRVGEGWEGTVSTAGHEFAGMTARFSQRHVEWDGLVNLSVLSGSQTAGEGWGQVPASFAP